MLQSKISSRKIVRKLDTFERVRSEKHLVTNWALASYIYHTERAAKRSIRSPVAAVGQRRRCLYWCIHTQTLLDCKFSLLCICTPWYVLQCVFIYQNIAERIDICAVSETGVNLTYNNIGIGSIGLINTNFQVQFQSQIPFDTDCQGVLESL